MKTNPQIPDPYALKKKALSPKRATHTDTLTHSLTHTHTHVRHVRACVGAYPPPQKNGDCGNAKPKKKKPVTAATQTGLAGS